MVEGLKWWTQLQVHADSTVIPQANIFVCFLSLLFVNLTSSNFSVQVERFTVAPDHNKWHTQSIELLRTSDQPDSDTSTYNNIKHSQQTDIHAHGGIFLNSYMPKVQ